MGLKKDQAKQVDVLIVGSGPAGISTALHLVKINPEWAEKIVVLEKETHPREKLCGGGITSLGADLLASLGLPFDPPHVPIYEMRMINHHRSFSLRDDPAFRIVRRDEFDHWLVLQAEKKGVTVRQNEAVKKIYDHSDYVEIMTEQTTFHAKTVVAADGSRSFVRQSLQWETHKKRARLLEILTPENADEQPEFRDRTALFDFSHIDSGIQGYYWDFPSMIKDKPFMNRGIFDSRTWQNQHPVSLKKTFRKILNSRGRNLDDFELKGYPIQCFNRHASFSRPRILLVGDAAGVDPLLGEGISFAIAYGEAAAAEINEAFKKDDFSFFTYKKRILKHPVLKQLKIRTTMSRMLYRKNGPVVSALTWSLIALLFKMTVWYRRLKQKEFLQ